MNKEWMIAFVWAVVAFILIVVIGWCIYVSLESVTSPGSDMPLPLPDQVLTPPNLFPVQPHDVKG